MSNWKIDIVAPNGLTGQLVVDEIADPVKEFAAFIASCREHDVPPDAETTGPAAIQPRKEPPK